ncbi:type II secretion system protein [Vibrio sp. WXL103]|uniref:type II secretion system protein n=1 Tax=unclassified Vibrio TaxID=2614977 RepID=UPI003EC5D8A5
MKGRFKQRGAMIAGMMLTLTVISIGTMYYTQYRTQQHILNNTESFYNHIVFLRQQIHAYATDRYLDGWPVNGSGIFPSRLSDLEGNYYPSCSDTDNAAGFCRKVDQTPWGSIPTSSYRRVPVPSASNPQYYRAEIDIALPSKTDPLVSRERSATLSLLAQLPNVNYNDVTNTLTVRVDRPDKAFAYQALVKRSGDDSTLTGDWDVGGTHAITNARDLTIRNSDNTQTLVSQGLTYVVSLTHNQYLDKPSCPSGLTPEPSLTIGSVTAPTGFTLTGHTKPYIKFENSNRWQFGLDIGAVDSTGTTQNIHTGEIVALIQCN